MVFNRLSVGVTFIRNSSWMILWVSVPANRFFCKNSENSTNFSYLFYFSSSWKSSTICNLLVVILMYLSVNTVFLHYPHSGYLFLDSSAQFLGCVFPIIISLYNVYNSFKAICREESKKERCYRVGGCKTFSLTIC